MRSSRQIEQDIERTRHEMDETLDEFRERMKPRHLLDEAIGMIKTYAGSGDGSGNGDGSGVGQHLAHGAKDAAQHVSHALFETVKCHPLPSLLIGAGAAWLIYEATSQSRWPDWEHMGENSPQDFRGRRSRGRARSYDGDESRRSFVEEDFPEEGSLYYGGGFETRRPEPAAFAAWHEEYDWTDEDERAWSQNAYAAIAEMETTLADENRPARERMRTVAGHLKNLSGQKYQSRWREWKERSGSVVDARTGLPYDESYGDVWGEAEGLDYLLESQHEEDEGLKQKAEGAVARMREALSKGGRSVRRKLADVASHASDFAATASGRSYRGARHAMGRAGSGIASAGRHAGRAVAGAGRRTGSAMAGAGRQTGHAITEGGRWVGHEATEAARMTRRGAMYAGRQVRRGAVATTQNVGEAIEEHPLAAGAAFLGLGLLVGLLVPETPQEDRLMGETSDRMKRQAYEAGKDAAKRAGHVAKETLHAAAEEAERQGIAPSQLAQQASEAVSQMAHSAKDQASGASAIVDKVEQVARTAAQTAKSEAKQEAKQSKAAHLADDRKS